MNKIPQDLRLIVSREIKGGDWELDLCLKVLHQELEARERAAGSHNTYSPTTNTPHRTNDQPWDDPPTASALTSTSRTSPTCTYCKQSHASNKCTTVTDAQKRKEILRKEGRCYVGLKKRHLSRDCPSQNKCFKYNGRASYQHLYQALALALGQFSAKERYTSRKQILARIYTGSYVH